MNKAQFIRAISEKSNLSIKDTAVVFESLVDVITETLGSGEKIQIPGFGNFELKDKAAREGINPATKERVHIPASKAPVLKFGKSFKDMFNQK